MQYYEYQTPAAGWEAIAKNNPDHRDARLQIPSVEGPCEIAAPSSALGVVGGCLPVSRAEALLAKWQQLLRDNREIAEKTTVEEYASIAQGMTDALDLCICDVRREMEAATVRQPEENTKLRNAHNENGKTL